MSTLSSKLLTSFFLLGAIGPLPSIFLYVFLPSGTVEFFNGASSPTASFWCSVNGSADATISFLCFSALFTKSTDIKVLVLRAFAIYAVFHWGAFWWWSNHGDDAHPEFMTAGYPIAIGTSLAAVIWWGWLYPPQDEEVNAAPYETLED
jgi:hypothetical protein